MLLIRKAGEKDLEQLLLLYTHLGSNEMPQITEEILTLWSEILESKNQHVLVGELGGKIVSSCVLVINQNLTHSHRPYSFIENVVTHCDYRRRGYASQLLAYCRGIAEKHNCYKIMLMTGSKKESTLNFYEKAGFNRNDKTAFICWLE